MFSTIRNRLILIAVLILGSIGFLIPTNQTIRERGADGVMHDIKVRRIPLKLGLDLQGGMHLGLELDESQKVSADKAKDTELAVTVLRKRVDEFGVTEPLIQRVGSRIVVELAGIKEPERAIEIVKRAATLEFRFTDKTGAFDKALPELDRTLARLGIKGSTSAAPEKGVAALLGGDTTKKKGDTTNAAKDSSSSTILQGLIQPAAGGGLTPIPGAYMVRESAYPRVDSLLNMKEIRALWPRGIELKWINAPFSIGTEPMRILYALSDKAIVTGADLVDATAQIDQLSQKRIVTFELNRSGGRTFGAQTGAHIGDYMAILLDGVVQGQPPVIMNRIDRHGQIELGNRSLQEAQDLALTLRAGALPIPLKVVEERLVLASLGSDSIRDGIIAGLVGTALVVIIMIGYYRMAGVLAVGALALYILFTLAGLSAMNATLTLPGIAGIVLSVGIAVDANVLIFERIREELIAGRTVRLAISEGFKHAMNAIIDSNVSTVITALFLFQFGTGPVKGFAVTLIMGIAASMVTAIFVTRTFFDIWLERNPSATTLSI